MHAPTSASIPDPQLDYAELERLHYHADTALHSRINLLLVAESLYLAALSQVWSNGGLFIQATLCAFGLLTTFLVGASTEPLARRTRWLAKQRMLHYTYKEYFNSISDLPIQTKRLAEHLPNVLALGWIILFVAVSARHLLYNPLKGLAC